MKSLQLRLGVICALATLSLAPICKGDAWDKKTKISIDSPLAVPGAVLPPGTYVMKLVNSSSNRHIVQIMNDRENHTYSTSFTASAERLIPADRTVLTFYEGRGDEPHALRDWYYPGDTIGEEFLYPKDRARLLAVSNTTQTTEVAQSSKSEVNTAESTTPAPAPEIVTPPPPVQQAEVQPIPTPAPEEPQLLAQVQEPPKAEPPPAATEPAIPPAAPAELPKTASELPLIALGGLSALGLALGLRRWERSVNH